MYIDVPCGCCGECRQKKIDEFCVRAYYEALSTFVASGFVMMHTLTYSEDNVPTFKGFKVFNYKHYTQFMKNLRNYLTSHSYDHVGKLKVLFVSEFGGTTFRPHYHPVFFVNFPISVEDFDNAVNTAWKYGFTQTTNPSSANKYYKRPDLCYGGYPWAY